MIKAKVADGPLRGKEISADKSFYFQSESADEFPACKGKYALINNLWRFQGWIK